MNEGAVKREITLDATVENMDEVMDFIRGSFQEAGCPKQVIMATLVATEEMYVNVAHYAYAPETGSVTVCCETNANEKYGTITLTDSGMPFNPLAKEDANIMLSAEEREIGGLGILMVKRIMDEVAYSYEGGKNCFTMTKKFYSEKKEA
ncbi:MAG: ATP-binding protein [Lachnospiraceae bacterium]|jgi:serine/threonine-protein kinase RsbW|nr:ATP-binding protein [Lachnospiraceae bacterium]MCI1726176.1 ATP-binding protein [Lachnospiraceae bacterium]